MSLTHYPSHLQDTQYCTHHHPYPIMNSSPQTTLIYSTNQQPKQPMFEKPLTPSDVGKLNRLVIPKQYAERYFPLSGVDSGVDQQKELLLCFEDEAGKEWKFRYSYWNSSQSYVLTKGWSRYVKEKKLDAGDVVLFERHRFDGDRLFIGWRRRHAGGAQDSYPAHHGYHLPNASLSYPCQYQHGSIHAGGLQDNVENNQRYVVASGNVPRRVRLFGVNLECPNEYEPSDQDGSSQGGQSHIQYSSGSNNITHNMNINFSQLRYHQNEE